jgi:hypothetical protein
MFERRHERLSPLPVFLWRAAGFAAVALGVLAFGLGIGVLGYHHYEGLGWLDSLLNASMILGGMGPVTELHHRAGKIFASFYALFSGVIFLVIFSVLLAPWVHRTLHHFHVEPLGPADEH